VAALGKKGDDAAAVPNTASEYMLQQIVFVVPKGAGQAVENQRKSEANAYRGRFQGCQQALESARGLNGVVVKPPVRRDESQLQDDTKTALAALQVGGTTAPERTADGFQVLAICAKNAISGTAASNEDLRTELANERGQLLARRYLRDLRADAVIEYR
jgi:peptidyl-prolyl cis-trans isomerase SurA